MGLGFPPLRRTAARLGATVVNGLEVARFGGLRTDTQPTPRTVVGRVGIADLRRYHDADTPADAPVVLLVPPLMMTAEVWDVSPRTSAVAALHRAGIDPWVVDFGSPEEVEGGRGRTLTDHVLAVSEAVDRVRAETGRDVHLAGYSQGGMFCYQVAAHRRSEGVASVITFGSPVDIHRGIPFGLPVEEAAAFTARLLRTLFAGSAVPGWVTRTGFKLLDPVKTVRARVDFVRQLHDRDSLLDREPQRRFLDGEGFIAWPGPALAEVTEQFLLHNRMLSGGFEVDGRLVTLADVTVPILLFVGELDTIAAPGAVRAITTAAPRADVREVTLGTGHFGLVVGSRAIEETWPTVAAWVHHHEGGGPLPDTVGLPLTPDESGPPLLPDALQLGALAVGLGVDVTRGVVRTAARGLATASDVVESATGTVPRMRRLERVEGDSLVSLGRLLAEQARGRPEATFFLFDGRGYSYADANRRVDAVVRGLVSVGVRPGEHVGVLMDTRPSGLAVVAALSRIGAVAVMLRPLGGDLAREADLGAIRRVVADPEHADAAAAALAVPVLVLGGGGQDRDLGRHVTDLERIDPDSVALPGWYAPDPGRARDLAFVVFSGSGGATRANRISNRRWVLSALGTASAASLTESDTVYGITPLHHPSGLMTAIGGALAGGARLALTATHDPETFWTEVRRYGVTVVAYVWASVGPLVDAPHDPRELHHPIRLFVGSGMPASVWRRVLDRFAPATVLEFYASTEGQAVLANLDGRRIGVVGRRLPGSVDVAVARYDLDAQRLVVRDDGFAVRAAAGEVGLLLAEVPPDARAGSTSPLRSVFHRGDEWRSTGDLFTVDAAGNHRFAGSVGGIVRTNRGAVPTARVEDAVGRCPGVAMTVAYGVPGTDGREVLVVAVVEESTVALDVERLATIVADRLPAGHVPTIVQTVDAIETTSWFRPVRGGLRAAGVDARRAWLWHPIEREYVRITADQRDRLLAG